MTKPNRIAWLVLWPNVRPWHFTNPQPMLRCLDDADTVAPMLAAALEADDGGQRRQRCRRAAQPLRSQPASAVRHAAGRIARGG